MKTTTMTPEEIKEKMMGVPATFYSKEDNNGWISVSDELPKSRKQSVIVTDGYYYAIGVYIGIPNYEWDLSSFIPNIPTHWQPIPPLPKKSKP